MYNLKISKATWVDKFNKKKFFLKKKNLKLYQSHYFRLIPSNNRIEQNP